MSEGASKYILKLYVKEQKSSEVRRFIKDLSKLCKEELHDEYELKIVDLSEPERIISVQALVKSLPPVLRKFFENVKSFLVGMDLVQNENKD